MYESACPEPIHDVIIAPTRGRNDSYWAPAMLTERDHRPYEGSQHYAEHLVALVIEV